MFAVVKTGGKQYKVAKGDVIQVEKLDHGVGESVTLDKVLLFSEGDTHVPGAPYVENCTVTCTVTGQEKAKKIIVFKKKRRKNYRRKNGHRQQLTRLMVTDISKK
ncbi:MAG: 50S ribosomal protein L21 [Nitrospinaceae bacterium]|jgi:large subunit ribosomal protein L21|nr:MAG: 50S ribosomal protein L21 [Nitrospinaceae bacterium]